MYATLIRASRTWTRVVISDSELKPLELLREYLNRLHAERAAPTARSAFLEDQCLGFRIRQSHLGGLPRHDDGAT